MVARNDTAFNKNTQPGPAAATTSPPSAGPMALARLNPAPFNATAFASWRGGTTSATIACQAGLLIDPPRPSAKVRTSNATGVVRSANVSQLRTPAATSIQVWQTRSSRRRSTRSANAPAGRPTRRTGRLVAVCINATSRGEGVNVVISQATPTFCIHVPTLDTTDAIHMARNAATASGLQAASRTRGLLTIRSEEHTSELQSQSNLV